MAVLLTRLTEHIRKRPGMYLGDLSFPGLKNLFGYLLEDMLDNSNHPVDISIEFKPDNRVSVVAEGLDTNLFVAIVYDLNTQFSSLGYGLPVIIALSEYACIHICNNASVILLNSERSQFDLSEDKSSTKLNRLTIDFKLEECFFENRVFDYEILNQYFAKFALLNSKARIVSIDSRGSIQQTNLFIYPDGLSHHLDLNIGAQLYGKPFMRLDIKARIEDYDYDICFAWLDIWLGQTNVTTFANYDTLILGGSFEQGILDGIRIVLKKLALEKGLAPDIASLKKQFLLSAAVKGADMVFSGATKTKLHMPAIRRQTRHLVSDRLADYLAGNREAEAAFLKKHTFS